MGGEAIANGDDVADWDGAERLIDSRRSTPSARLDVLVNNAGILRDRMLVNMTEDEWDAVISVHLQGHVRAQLRHAAAYWREQVEGGRRPSTPASSTPRRPSGIFGNVGQANYGAAKAGIAAFTVIAADGAGPLRRHGQRHRPGRPHPHDREPRRRRLAASRSRPTSSTAWRPRTSSPLVVWLGSAESGGRSPAGCSRSPAGKIGVAEGWHAGPERRQGRPLGSGRARRGRARARGRGHRMNAAGSNGRGGSTDKTNGANGANGAHRPEVTPPEGPVGASRAGCGACGRTCGPTSVP